MSSFDSSTPKDYRMKADEGFLGKIMNEQRTIYIEDAENDPVIMNPYLKQAKIKSLLRNPSNCKRKNHRYC